MPQAESLRKEPNWAGYRIPAFLGGLNTMSDPDDIQDIDLSRTLNVLHSGGRVVSDSGIKFADATNVWGVAGIVASPFVNTRYEYIKKIFDFIAPGGQTETLIITNLTMYKLVSGNYWTVVSNGVSGTATTLGLSPRINTADWNSFTVGQPISLEMSDGSYLSTYVTAKAASYIEIPATAWLLLDFVGMDNPTTITEGVLFTDDPDAEQQVVSTQVPSAGWFVFTNGLDSPYYYDGSTVQHIAQLESRQVVCKTLSLFNNHLVLGNCTEAGVDRPWRVMWSDTANYGEWDDTVGNAGFEDLADTRDDIIGMKPLGQYNIVYRRRSFVRQEFEGSEARLFFFRRIILGSQQDSAGIGLVAPNAVFAMQDFHVFLSDDGLYKYEGSYAVSPISQRVFRGHFDKGGEVSKANITKAFLQFVDETNELFVFYNSNVPHLTEFDLAGNQVPTKFCDRALRLNLENGTWWKRTLPAPVTASSIYFSTAAKTWDQLEDSWDEQLWAWNASSIGAGTPKMALGMYQIPWVAASQSDPTDSRQPRIGEYDFISSKDLYYNIGSVELFAPGLWLLDTKNYHFLDPYRLDYVELAHGGSGNIVIEMSTDKGVSWTVIAQISGSDAMTYTRSYYQAVSLNFMFRIRGETSGVELGSFAFSMRPESQW